MGASVYATIYLTSYQRRTTSKILYEGADRAVYDPSHLPDGGLEYEFWGATHLAMKLPQLRAIFVCPGASSEHMEYERAHPRTLVRLEEERDETGENFGATSGQFTRAYVNLWSAASAMSRKYHARKNNHLSCTDSR